MSHSSSHSARGAEKREKESECHSDGRKKGTKEGPNDQKDERFEAWERTQVLQALFPLSSSSSSPCHSLTWGYSLQYTRSRRSKTRQENNDQFLERVE